MSNDINKRDPEVRIEDIVYPIEIDNKITEDIRNFNIKLQMGNVEVEELNLGY